MSKWLEFRQASRLHFVPLTIICVLQGVLAAWIWNDSFNLWIFGLTVIGSSTLHIFSMMLNDLWDYRSGVDVAAYQSDESISTDSGYLTAGKWSEQAFAMTTWSMLVITLICMAILYIVSGWGVLLLGGIGCLLALFYVVPPIKYGYIGKGSSELAHVLCFGVFPVMGAYYVQTGHFDIRLFFLSLPMGLLTTLTFFNHHFLHWKTDKQIGKRTLVVMWGEQKSFRFSIVLLCLSLASIVVCVWVGGLPSYGILALLTAIPLCRMYQHMKNKRNLQTHQQLLWLSLRTSLQCGAVMIIVLLIGRWMWSI